MIVAGALEQSNFVSIALAVGFALLLGCSLMIVSILRAGVSLVSMVPLALVPSTLSEIVNNPVTLVVPGAIETGLDDLLFRGSLTFALAVAFVAAFPINRYLIARGRRHAVVHEHHHGAHHCGRS